MDTELALKDTVNHTTSLNVKLVMFLDVPGFNSAYFFQIKVDQIACEATYRAPTDCVQYHTGLSGTFMSFNHPDYIPQGQHYAICIRQEEGHCSIAYSTNPIGSNEDFR